MKNEKLKLYKVVVDTDQRGVLEYQIEAKNSHEAFNKCKDCLEHIQIRFPGITIISTKLFKIGLLLRII